MVDRPYDEKLLEWKDPGFDEFMRIFLDSFDADPEARHWVHNFAIPDRDRWVEQNITAKKASAALEKMYMSIGIPNFHSFGFLVCLQPGAGLGGSGMDVCAGVVRAGALLCGLREFKRQTLAAPCELEEEIVSGFAHNRDAFPPCFTHRRHRLPDGMEVYGLKSKEARAPQGLVVTLCCLDCVFTVVVDESDSPADVTLKLAHAQRLARAESPNASTGTNAFCAVTYLAREQVMKSIAADRTFEAAWNAVQDSDIVLSLFPDIASATLNEQDPIEGGMGFLRHVPKGGTVGDKNTLGVLADGFACYAWDHATMDGSPAMWLSTQSVRLADAFVKKQGGIQASVAAAEKTDSASTIFGVTAAVTTISLPPEDASSSEFRAAVREGLAFGSRLLALGRGSTRVRTTRLHRGVARSRGLSTDALANAAVHLALRETQDFARERGLSLPNLLNQISMSSQRHFKDARISLLMANSPSLYAFSDAVRAGPSKGYSDVECASLLMAFSGKHKMKIKDVKKTVGDLILCRHLAGIDESPVITMGKWAMKAIEDKAPPLASFFVNACIVSNGTSWPGLALWTTVTFQQLNIGYMSTDEGLDFDLCWKQAEETAGASEAYCQCLGKMAEALEKYLERVVDIAMLLEPKN